MDKLLKSTTSPLHSSVKLETKHKFDALLKEALNAKTRKNALNKSTQKLIPPDIESLSSSNENLPDNSIEVVQADVHDNNFILNKFLNDSSKMRNTLGDNDNKSVKDDKVIVSPNIGESDGLFIKPPVPRPRKNKQAPSVASSTNTHKIIKDSEESKSLNTPSKIESDKSTSSNVTSVIKGASSSNNLGFLIINNEIRKSQLSVINKSKEDVNAITELSNSREVLKSPKIKIEDASSDKISQKSEASTIDDIRYENEVQPKSRRRQLEKPKQRETFKNVAETLIANQLKVKYSYEKIIAITVHKTDRLKLDSLVIHPVVKIHLVNSKTGEYLSKSDKDRAVVFYYENKNIKYITPVISESYNLYEKCSLFPAWEETLIINEDINYLLAQGGDTVIFFEIMDFMTFSVASAQFNQKGTSKGWHKIAWAFLKPIGKNDASNLNKVARLQLYYPGKQMKVSPQVCDIFHWWKSKKLLKYPSSLYVNVRSVIPPEKVAETLRSKTPIHGEKASITTTFNTNTNTDIVQKPLSKSASSDKVDSISGMTENVNDIVWSRSSYQICKLPNKCVAELSSYEEGCFMLKFSKSGLYLACAVRINDIYWIIVYSIKTYEEVCKYSGHQGLIYDINWSVDDNFILTASADCTVCIWNFVENVFVEMLPHPSYVYASEISLKSVIATGCYDQIVRIWQHQMESQTQYNLIQELEGHCGYVTSLCFNRKNTLLYSSDSVGTIIEWKYNTSESSWNLKREFKLPDLRNTIINQILLHLRERRLLVHARDSTLRIVDLKTGCVLYWLQGAVNNRFKTTCCFSPCGNFVLAGSENGLINVWNSDVGKLTATYTPYNVYNYQNLPIHCIHFHPHDNIVALSHYGRNLPILMVMYDSTCNESNNVGQRILQSDDEMETVKKKSKSKALTNLKCSVEKVITENSVSEKKQGHIKFEDVLNKIDQIVNQHPINDTSSSLNNNNIKND